MDLQIALQFKQLLLFANFADIFLFHYFSLHPTVFS